MSEKHWISKWLDHNSFSSADDVRSSLRSPAVVAELRRLARKANNRTLNQEITSPATTNLYSIVAGCGIDLSAREACAHADCRKKQVDELFGRVWHYFDRIIVHDDVTPMLDKGWEIQGIKENFIAHTEVLFHLRQIGAEDIVEFQTKPGQMCAFHIQETLKEVGLPDINRHVEEMVSRLLPTAKIAISLDVDDIPSYRVEHALFEVVHRGRLEEDLQKEISGSLEAKALTLVIRELLASLSFDIAAAHRHGASLGLALKAHEMFLRQIRPTQISEVVLNLQLPVLDGLTTWDLIALRRDESEYFSRFRDALTLAIKERLKIEPDSNSQRLATELREDLIEPRLRDISRRLSAAQTLLTKKSGVGLFLSAVSTTCGIVSGLDPHVASMGGAAVAVAYTGTAVAKYLEEERDITMDGMYFLWKAVQCVPS